MRACLGERAWTAAGARGLGREGPKDNPCLRLAQEEDKCLEIVCKWRRNHKSQTAKEGTGAWGCWRQGGRKGRAARGMVGGRAANGWLYGNCELVVETPGWMETGFERQGYSWRRTRWCAERETGIHDRSCLSQQAVSKVSSVLPDCWARGPGLSCQVVTSAFSMFLSMVECVLEFIRMFMLASFCQLTFSPVLGMLWVGSGWGREEDMWLVPLHHSSPHGVGEA